MPSPPASITARIATEFMTCGGEHGTRPQAPSATLRAGVAEYRRTGPLLPRRQRLVAGRPRHLRAAACPPARVPDPPRVPWRDLLRGARVAALPTHARGDL